MIPAGGGESSARRSEPILPSSSAESSNNNSGDNNNNNDNNTNCNAHPIDTAGANAEAARLAVALGVASSVRKSESSPPSRKKRIGSMLRRDPNKSKSSTATSTTSSSITGTVNNNNNVASMGSASFHRMGSDGSTTSAPSSVHSTVSASLLSEHGRRNSALSQQSQSQQQPYVPPKPGGVEDLVVSTSVSVDHHNAPIEPEPPLYDMHGQRAPYREGPYDFFHTHDGRQMRKRWYGRMEDGYLAWSSIYLHEYFGFTIYTPLTHEEQEEMKKPNGKIPKWMDEVTSLPNLAIFLSYFCIGVALQLLRTPLIVYFIEDLNATAAEVNVLFTVMAVPWCFKVIYGFLSDCLPISGLRRKPYFMTGWLIYILSNLILMLTPIPSIQLCILLVFTQTAGYMLADVMTDALIVERSRYETQDSRGTLQSKGYIVRFFGSTVGAAIGAVVYNKDGWNWYLPIRLVFFINAAFPMVFLVPLVPYLLELETDCDPKNLYVQCKDLFHTAQLRAVWQPMTFVYIYNALQLTNAAWMNFLVEGLDFSAWQIGIVSIVGSIMAWFGIMCYKRFFFASNWRIVYFWCTTLASSIALGQLILVFGLNNKIGIPDIWFSMGDDVLVEFVIAVQFLPMCIMYLGLCPPGSEGTTYAMLTTWSNLAGSLAFDISTALTVVWDVSSATIAAGSYGGIWKLSLLCGLIGPVPLLLLGLIPKNKEDQRRLQKDTTRHYWAGVAFISVMIVTLLITFAESIYEVYFNDESDGYESERIRHLSMMMNPGILFSWTRESKLLKSNFK